MNVDTAITPEELAAIHALIAQCDDGAGDEPFNSHGALMLVTMLLGDIALAQRRPGSWEGANMLTVLAAHGYT